MNFEKDYLGRDNTQQKKNKWDTNDIKSNEDRPNLDVLKKQRDKYIDQAIEESPLIDGGDVNRTIGTIRQQVFRTHGIEQTTETGLFIHPKDPNVSDSEKYRELLDTYSEFAIAKRLLAHPRAKIFTKDQKELLTKMANK